MQALFDAAKTSVQEIGKGARETSVYKEECLKLGRYVSKVTLILAELELQLYADESLRGSKDMFMAAEAVLGALQQAASLVNQCSSTSSGRIWPMEDAIAFQSVSLELLNAMEKVASVQFTLPEDLEEDVEHFLRQLKTLKFTEEELEESEEVELKELQEENKKAREGAISAGENFENNNIVSSSLGVETPPGSKAGSPPLGTISNIKPFRSSAAPAAAAAAAAAAAPAVVEDLDDTWEAIENEEETEVARKKEAEKDGEGEVNIVGEEVLNTEEQEERFEEDSVSVEHQQTEIPPPDENLLKILDQQGVAYVNIDNPTETILPPGAPVPGAVEQGEEAKLPSDPFSMQAGAEAQVQEGARLSEKTMQELEQLKKEPDSSASA